MLAEDELRGVPLLVFANKQDIAGALGPDQVSDKLGLAGAETGRQWSVRGSCATKGELGEGLEEGLDWYVFSISLWWHISNCVVGYIRLASAIKGQ